MKMSDDSGNLSIDFLVGFTIFIIAFIWVVSMIPGLLINLQGYTIDSDAVAYRTGVILAEDPGEPPIPAWEKAPTPNDVVRFGLSLSKDTPNILSEEKVNQFFCTSVFSYPNDYHERVIFGDYPYRFNISLTEFGNDHPSQYVGDIMSGSYGTIRRLVKIKGTSNATINYIYMKNHGYIRGDNETQHEFSIVINNTELVKDKVTDPVFQINPALEKITVNITDLNKTMFADRESCFNVSLKRVYLYVEDEKITPLHLYYTPIINGIQYEDLNSDDKYSTTLPKDIKNISLVFYPKTLSWSDYSHVYINLTFDLVKTNLGCACPTCPGSQFLNNTPGIPFDYNYHPDNVTQPNLRDATLEVNVGSGYLTATESLIKPLNADFIYVLTGGTTVKFLDKSTGTPVSWAWDFGNGPGSTSTQNNPTYTFSGPGTYHVKLTVKNAAGNSYGPVSKDVTLLQPVAGFTSIPPSPVSGSAPLPVVFTDTSTNTPTSWMWEFNTSPTNWYTFSTAQNPTYNFPVGNYKVRLTATNPVGSNTTPIPAYITVLSLPVADFSANKTSGVVSLPVKFTDNSLNGPMNSWKWEYNETSGGGWQVFGAGVQNPEKTFSTGVYDIRLTVTNGAGSTPITKYGYIKVSAAPPSIPWYCGWGSRKNITIDHTKVGATLTNFPVLINLNSDANLKSSARSDGYDILFTSSDGTTKLPHEIESYTSSSGALVAWVNVPSVSSTTDTTIIMYYNNSGASNQQNANGVWDSNYKAVWHLKENPAGTAPQMLDSTSNANRGTSNGIMTSSDQVIAKINGGLDLDGSNDYILSGSNIGITGNAVRTITFWANLRNTNRNGIVNWGTNNNNAEFGIGVRNNHYLLWGYGGGNDWDTVITPATSSWHYQAIIVDGTTARWYVDGSQIGSGFSHTFATTDSSVSIGREKDGGTISYMNGIIDEVRISNSARSTSWITTEYNNQNSPATFYSLNSQQLWTC